jgi:hypothetical protein
MALIRDDLGQRAFLIEPIKFSPTEGTGEVPQPTQLLDVTQLVELAAVGSVNTVLLLLPSGRIEVKQVLLEGLAQLEESNLSATARALLPMLLGALAGRRSRDDLSTAIQRIRADLRSLDGVLATVQHSLDEAVTPLTSGSDANAWWRARERQIQAAENDGDDDHGLSLWVDAFTEALAAGEAAVCLQIIDFGNQRSPELAGAMSPIITAVGSDFHDAAPGALDLLLAESLVTP